jgi:hypothetical protein
MRTVGLLYELYETKNIKILNYEKHEEVDGYEEGLLCVVKQ